eukprot:scaffold16513_cov79-Phaeocystis_antarctica.AAC.3
MAAWLAALPEARLASAAAAGPCASALPLRNSATRGSIAPAWVMVSRLSALAARAPREARSHPQGLRPPDCRRFQGGRPAWQPPVPVPTRACSLRLSAQPMGRHVRAAAAGKTPDATCNTQKYYPQYSSDPGSDPAHRRHLRPRGVRAVPPSPEIVNHASRA